MSVSWLLQCCQSAPCSLASLPRHLLDESAVCHKAGGCGRWPRWRRGGLHHHRGLDAEEQTADEENGAGHGDHRLCHLWGKELPWGWQWSISIMSVETVFAAFAHILTFGLFFWSFSSCLRRCVYKGEGASWACCREQNDYSRKILHY